MAYIVNPFQRIVAVHFPENARGAYQVAVFDYHSVSDDCAHPFLCRLETPAGLAARWNTTNDFADDGAYICGKYQSGLGGPYAYAGDRRSDPNTGADPLIGTFQLPTEAEFAASYLWHCGSPLASSLKYETCLINMTKIFDDYGESGEPFPITYFRANSLAQPLGNGDLTWRLRYYGYDPDSSAGPSDVSFSVNADGQVTPPGLLYLGMQTGNLTPSIAYAVGVFV